MAGIDKSSSKRIISSNHSVKSVASVGRWNASWARSNSMPGLPGPPRSSIVIGSIRRFLSNLKLRRSMSWAEHGNHLADGSPYKNRFRREFADILQEKNRQRVSGVRMLIRILREGEQVVMLDARSRTTSAL